MNQVFRFWNPKASSIRSLLVANCIESPNPSAELTTSDQPCSSKSLQRNPIADNSWRQCDRVGNPPSHAFPRPMDQDLRCVNSRGLRATLQGAFQNWKPLDNVADIDYSQEFHRSREEERDKLSAQSNSTAQQHDSSGFNRTPSRLPVDSDDGDSQETPASHKNQDQDSLRFEPYLGADGEDVRRVQFNKPESGESSSCDGTSPCATAPESKNEGPCRTEPHELDTENIIDPRDKWLIFTCGSETYTPHQIGFKKIKSFKFKSRLDPGLSLQDRVVEYKRRKALEENGQNVEQPDYSNYAAVADRFDTMDCVIDLHGHIIGMTLSPDHRYLYVNSRPWPSNYTISDPLHPPPIAQEIDIHVIDLVTLK